MAGRMRILSLAFALGLVGCGGSMPSTGGNGTTGGGGTGGSGGGGATDLPDMSEGGGGTGGGGGGGDASGDMGGPTTVPNGTATISGTINGYTVATPKSVVAVVTGTSFNVYIADRADLCAVLQKGASPSSTTFLAFGSTAGSGPHTFPAGSYTYPSGSGSGGGTGGGSGGGTGGGTGGGGNGMGTRSALIATSDANCGLTGYNQASTGSFTTKAPVDATAKTIDGTFDITFDVTTQMGTFTGTFSAAVCPNATDIPLSAVACD